MATREEVDRMLGAYEPGPDDPALSDLMRGHLEAAGAGVEPAGPAAGVPAGTAEPIPDGTLRVASGPVVMLGYEDAAPWLARWLDDRAGTTHHARAVTDPERLSVAAVDAPLFGVTLGAGREAIPGPLASWRPLWDAAAIGARLVIIDPVALAGQWDGYSALPVGTGDASCVNRGRLPPKPPGIIGRISTSLVFP